MNGMNKKMKAFTLIEYMVSSVIGLILLAGFSYLFIGMRLSISTQSGISEIQENGRFALFYLSNDIQNAGWMELTDNGFGVLVNGINDSVVPYVIAANTSDGGGASASDEIAISYQATTDCLGNAAPADGIITNHYYVDSNQLMCRGIAGNPQPLIAGVEVLHFIYGIDTDGTSDGVPNKFVRADQIAGDEFEKVAAVKVILVLSSSEDIREDAIAQSFQIPGENGSLSLTDKKIRKLFSTTINLPNQPIYEEI